MVENMTRRALLRCCSLILILLLTAAGVIPVRAGPAPDETRRRLRLPILMYHYISIPPADADQYRLDLSVSPELFGEHLRWLRENGYVTITLDDVVRALTAGAPLPERAVVLTFDDGYEDAYTHAFPLLEAFGMTGTFFVVTEWIDARTPGYLTWDQAREMAAGGMSIQSHTRSHPDLTGDCDYDCLVYQVLGSVQTIEAEIGVRPQYFCYPSGRYNDEVLRVVKQVGLTAAVTTQAGTIHTSDQLLELSRARIRNTTTVDDLAWIVNTWRE
jgi:peptidoglycan/xylan/chitin deacetylase (PgdA/CDA1 family)